MEKRVFFSMIAIAAIAAVVSVLALVLVIFPRGVREEPRFGFAATYGTEITVCQVFVIDVLHSDNDNRVIENNEEIIVCNILTDEGVSDEYMYVDFEDGIIERNRPALVNHEWFIHFSIEWIQKGLYVDTLVIPSGENVETVAPSDVERLLGNLQLRRKLTDHSEQQQQHGRKLLAPVGEKETIIVLVDSLASDQHDIYDYILGNDTSMKTQIDDCSHSQATVVPHPITPVLILSPSEDISNYTFPELYQELVSSIRADFGLTSSQSIATIADLFVFVVPSNIRHGPREIAWAPVGGVYFGILHEWISSIQTLLHELGHDYGLAHAYENGVELADTSTAMGTAHRDVVKMCYNGQNMWRNGWFVDRRVEITKTPTQIETMELAFYGDYDKTSPDQPVLIRIGVDIFLTYNRKVGVNAETQNHADTLLVVQERMGRFHRYSELLVALTEEDDAYVIRQNEDSTNGRPFLIVIEVCNRTSAGNNDDPETLFITIGPVGGVCPSKQIPPTIKPTPMPSALPTSPPTTTEHKMFRQNKGMRGMHHSGVYRSSRVHSKVMGSHVETMKSSVISSWKSSYNSYIKPSTKVSHNSYITPSSKVHSEVMRHTQNTIYSQKSSLMHKKSKHKKATKASSPHRHTAKSYRHSMKSSEFSGRMQKSVHHSGTEASHRMHHKSKKHKHKTKHSAKSGMMHKKSKHYSGSEASSGSRRGGSKKASSGVKYGGKKVSRRQIRNQSSSAKMRRHRSSPTGVSEKKASSWVQSTRSDGGSSWKSKRINGQKSSEWTDSMIPQSLVNQLQGRSGTLASEVGNRVKVQSSWQSSKTLTSKRSRSNDSVAAKRTNTSRKGMKPKGHMRERSTQKRSTRSRTHKNRSGAIPSTSLSIRKSRKNKMRSKDDSNDRKSSQISSKEMMMMMNRKNSGEEYASTRNALR